MYFKQEVLVVFEVCCVQVVRNILLASNDATHEDQERSYCDKDIPFSVFYNNQIKKQSFWRQIYFSVSNLNYSSKISYFI